MDNVKESTTGFLTNLVSFEAFFALFLFAGVYNQTPWAEEAPVNITAMFVGLSFFAAIVAILRSNLRPQRDGLVLTALFSVFILYALVSFRWSPGGEYARGKALRLVATTLWALVGSALIISPQRKRIHRFLNATVIIGLFTATTTLLSSAGIIVNPSANYLISGRVIGLGALVLLWHLLAVPSSSWTRAAVISGLLISDVALIVAGGRAPFLSTLVAAVGLVTVLAVQEMRNSWTSHTTIADGGRTSLRWATAALVGIVGTAVSGGAVFILGWMPRTFMRLSTVSTGPTSSLGRRFGYWDSSLHTIDAAPLIGHGIGSWPTVTPGTIANYPHNIILEVLVEFGVVGLILLVAAGGFGLVSALRTMRGSTHSVGWLILGLVAFTFANALISGDINDNRYLFAYLGLLIAPALGVRDR